MSTPHYRCEHGIAWPDTCGVCYRADVNLSDWRLRIGHRTLAQEIGRLMRDNPGIGFDKLTAKLADRWTAQEVGDCLLRLLAQSIDGTRHI